jgi:hypothetical protein
MLRPVSPTFASYRIVRLRHSLSFFFFPNNPPMAQPATCRSASRSLFWRLNLLDVRAGRRLCRQAGEARRKLIATGQLSPARSIAEAIADRTDATA